MYAVIRAGGRQFRVAPGDVIKVDQKPAENGNVEFTDVLAVSGEPGAIVKPQSGARVVGSVVEEGRGDKILVFHYKRKKQFKKLQGHRQSYTAVRITEISLGDKKMTAPDAPARKKKKDIASDVAGAAGFAAGLAVGAAEVLTGKAKPAKKKSAGKTAAKKSSKKK